VAVSEKAKLMGRVRKTNLFDAQRKREVLLYIAAQMISGQYN
jgi:hypothetical protein